MEEKQKKYFEYVAWLEKQPNVIDFAKHYIETHKVAHNYFNINNQESVEFVTSSFANPMLTKMVTSLIKKLNLIKDVKLMTSLVRTVFCNELFLVLSED